jgi:hypothetical protein
MNNKAERELHRLSRSLARIERKFALSRSEIAVLRKASISLGLVFMHGLKPRLDYQYGSLGKPLTTKQERFLKETVGK